MDLWETSDKQSDIWPHWMVAHLSCLMTKSTKWLCAQWRLDQPGHLPSLIRPAWASAQSNQSSLCAQWVFKVSSCGQRRLIRLCGLLTWACRSFCWFCHEVAHLKDNTVAEVSQGELIVYQWSVCRRSVVHPHFQTWISLNLYQILCVESLGWGKSCIKLIGRLDQNSDFHSNQMLP